MWTNTMTNRAMARGRLISAVGAGSHSYLLPRPNTANTLQTKMKTNRVTAKGTIWAPRGPMLDSTCRFTVVIPSSHANCILPGTPAVARARTSRPERDRHHSGRHRAPHRVRIERETPDRLHDVVADRDVGQHVGAQEAESEAHRVTHSRGGRLIARRRRRPRRRGRPRRCRWGARASTSTGPRSPRATAGRRPARPGPRSRG